MLNQHSEKARKIIFRMASVYKQVHTILVIKLIIQINRKIQRKHWNVKHSKNKNEKVQGTVSGDNIDLLHVVNGTDICGTDIIATSTPTLIHTKASKNHSLAVSLANEKKIIVRRRTSPW